MIIQHWQCSGTKQSCKFWSYYTSKTTEHQPEGAATSTVAAGGLCSVPVVSNTHDWRSTNIRSRSLSLFVSNLLHSQPLLSDSCKVDVILYVLLGRFTQSLCRFFFTIYKWKAKQQNAQFEGTMKTEWYFTYGLRKYEI